MITQNLIKVHDTHEERAKSILTTLQKEKVPPGLVFSCQDGILLFAPKNFAAQKIWKVFDRIAFIGAGAPADYEWLYTWGAANAKLAGNLLWSPGDPRIFLSLKEELAQQVRRSFRNLFSSNYLECEVILAQVGFEPDEDQIFRVDCKGEVDAAEMGWLGIPQNHRFNWSGEELSALPIETVFRGVAQGLKEILEDEEAIICEVTILSRQAVREKRFEEVYMKLNQKQVNAWLSV